ATRELDLVDVHRLRVGLEDAVSEPLVKRPGRPPVVAAWTSQVDDVVRREPAIPKHIGVAEHVVWGRDQDLEPAPMGLGVPDACEGPNVSRGSDSTRGSDEDLAA